MYRDCLVLRGSRIIIPETYWHSIVKIAHEGHMGIVKTKQLFRDREWFPGIDFMVEEVVKQCQECQLKSDGGSHPHPLRMHQFKMKPWDKLQIDFHLMPNGYELLCIINILIKLLGGLSSIFYHK